MTEEVLISPCWSSSLANIDVSELLLRFRATLVGGNRGNESNPDGIAGGGGKIGLCRCIEGSRSPVSAIIDDITSRHEVVV